MAQAVTGFLSNTGIFYHTEDEALYHDHCFNLNLKIREHCDAYGIEEDGKKEAAEFFFNFSKTNSEEIIALLQCYQRLDDKHEAAGQLDEGGEGLRERVRGEVVPPVASEDAPERTSEQREEKAGDEEEVRSSGGEPSRPAEIAAPATDVVMEKPPAPVGKYKKGDRPRGWHPDDDQVS